jgi:hypothetical protein
MNKYYRLVGLIVFIGLTSINWSPQELRLQIGELEAIKGSGTQIVGDVNEALPAGKNVLWCATLQMAWDAAGAQLGRPLQLEPKSPLAGALNKRPFNLKWIDPPSVVVAQGTIGDGVLGEIDAKAKAKTGKPSKLLAQLKKDSAPSDLIFYALLQKNMEFAKPFGKLGSWDVGGRSVPWFGFAPDQQGTAALLDQTRVHHYGTKDDFVVELLTTESGDQLILAKLPTAPKSTEEISCSILARLQATPPRAAGNDLLAVPNIVAEELTTFPQLENHRVAGSHMFVRRAIQSIDFRMDEKGVKLSSEAAISFGCSASPQVIPRLLVLSPPFALIMKRKDAPEPYFIAWFANADLLRQK